MFTGLATLIFVVYWLVAISKKGGSIYNYWAILVSDLFLLIMWLCTFAILASKVAKVIKYKGRSADIIHRGTTTLNITLAASVVNL